MIILTLTVWLISRDFDGHSLHWLDKKNIQIWIRLFSTLFFTWKKFCCSRWSTFFRIDDYWTHNFIELTIQFSFVAINLRKWWNRLVWSHPIVINMEWMRLYRIHMQSICSNSLKREGKNFESFDLWSLSARCDNRFYIASVHIWIFVFMILYMKMKMFDDDLWSLMKILKIVIYLFTHTHTVNVFFISRIIDCMYIWIKRIILL